MIVRKIRPEEIKRTQELFAIAFESGTDISKTPNEIFDEIKTHPQSREDFYWEERWAAFEDDDRTMMSYFIAQPFSVHFDGNTYPMAGIGGVASLPQYRKQGGIRKCFEAALPSLYERGTVFSYLYPFSTCYYRKFGYEIGCFRLSYHVLLSSIRHFDVGGGCTLTEPGNYLTEEIRSIYQVWQNKYNMMVVNEDFEYAWTKKVNPVKDQIFTYVYKSKDGIPMGYTSFKQVQESDGRNIQCIRFCFTCAEGLKGLLNLLLSLGSDHSYATFELPSDLDISLLLSEWSMGAVSVKNAALGMVRVVNVEAILLGARYRGSGQLSIQISDPQIPQNCGVFSVTFQDGSAVEVRREDGAEAHISMNINQFSRLIIGASEVSAIEYMDGVMVNTDLERIGQVFFYKPNLIVEFF